MFSSDKNIDIITQLVGDIKKDVTLRYERLQINCVSKLSQLLSFIVVGAILFVLLSLAVMFVSMMVASALEDLIGNQTASYAIIVAFYVILGVIIYANKKKACNRSANKLYSQFVLGRKTSSRQRQ